jgi:hypothetical protein
MDADANGWRCHDFDIASNKDTMAPHYIHGYGVPGKTANLAPMYHILLRIYRKNLAAKVGNFDEVHGFVVDLMVNLHKMKGTGVKMDVMDLLYNELYFGVIEKRSFPYAPFVMKLIFDTWLKTFKTNLGANQHLNMTLHEPKKIHIMTHLAPKDSDDEASHEDVGGGDSSIVESSLAKKLLLKVKKNFCL